MSNIPPSIPPKKETPIKKLSPDSIAAKKGWKLSQNDTGTTTPRAARQSKKEGLADKSIVSRSMASGEISSSGTKGIITRNKITAQIAAQDPSSTIKGWTRVAETQPTISELKTQLRQQQAEIERLNDILEEAAEEALEHSELQTVYQNLTTAHDKLNEFNSTLMQKLEKAIESNEYAYSDIELYKDLAAEKVSQVEDLKNESTKFEKQLKESTRTITNLKSELDKSKDELDKLKTQIETLKTTNADLSKKNRSYVAEQEAAAKNQMKIIGNILGKKPELRNTTREKELDKQNKDLNKELKETKQELEEVKRFRLQDNKLNKSLKEENLTLTNKSRKLDVKNAKQAEEIEKLKAEIDKLRTENKELKTNETNHGKKH